MREGLEMGEAFHATVEVKTAEEPSGYAPVRALHGHGRS